MFLYFALARDIQKSLLLENLWFRRNYIATLAFEQGERATPAARCKVQLKTIPVTSARANLIPCKASFQQTNMPCRPSRNSFIQVIDYRSSSIEQLLLLLSAHTSYNLQARRVLLPSKLHAARGSGGFSSQITPYPAGLLISETAVLQKQMFVRVWVTYQLTEHIGLE